MRNSFSSRWTKHLSKDPAAAESLMKTILGSTIALDRLRELVEEEIRSLDVNEYSISDFEDPAWSHKQAFRNGGRAQLTKLLELLTVTK